MDRNTLLLYICMCETDFGGMKEIAVTCWCIQNEWSLQIQWAVLTMRSHLCEHMTTPTTTQTIVRIRNIYRQMHTIQLMCISLPVDIRKHKNCLEFGHTRNRQRQQDRETYTNHIRTRPTKWIKSIDFIRFTLIFYMKTHTHETSMEILRFLKQQNTNRWRRRAKRTHIRCIVYQAIHCCCYFLCFWP